MRCIWCGNKYSREFEEISAGFCSHTCMRKWEGSFEAHYKQLLQDETRKVGFGFQKM